MTTINKLSAVDSVVAADQVPIYSSANGDARKASITVLAAYLAEVLATGLPTTLPAAAGVLWNNGGVLCIS
jgi:hypothetical protein